LKSERSNRPSSDRTYYGAIITLFVKMISETFRCIGYRHIAGNIFKTKHGLLGIHEIRGDVTSTKEADLQNWALRITITA
jgi:hypothetical protein